VADKVHAFVTDLISLADMRLDADPGSTPSILELFGHGTPPHGLTRWGRAFLYALYNTDQWTKLETPELELNMVRYRTIGGRAAARLSRRRRINTMTWSLSTRRIAP
jgi:hypothetical protein